MLDSDYLYEADIVNTPSMSPWIPLLLLCAQAPSGLTSHLPFLEDFSSGCLNQLSL